MPITVIDQNDGYEDTNKDCHDKNIINSNNETDISENSNTDNKDTY